jgi:GTP cyclohydrolase I
VKAIVENPLKALNIPSIASAASLSLSREVDSSLADDGHDRPTSSVIRDRLLTAGERFFANDNISEYISENELNSLQDEVRLKLEDVLRALVIDVDHDHNTQDTAKRVAKMFVQEVFSGRYQPAPPVTEFPNAAGLNELMIVGPITVRSACSHHLCPIMGKVWIGVLPHESAALIGLSKYARLAEWVMNRPQIQEEAIQNLADEIEFRMAPKGLALLMDADHFCMHWRGVKDDQASMVNTVMRGAFQEDKDLRSEFFGLAKGSTSR